MSIPDLKKVLDYILSLQCHALRIDDRIVKLEEFIRTMSAKLDKLEADNCPVAGFDRLVHRPVDGPDWMGGLPGLMVWDDQRRIHRTVPIQTVGSGIGTNVAIPQSVPIGTIPVLPPAPSWQRERPVGVEAVRDAAQTTTWLGTSETKRFRFLYRPGEEATNDGENGFHDSWWLALPPLPESKA